MLPESRSGGPYVSHLRIMNSFLNKDYSFIPFFYPRCRKMLLPSFKRKLKKTIINEKPDLIHCIGLQLDGFLQVYNAKKIVRDKIKILLAVHGSQSELDKASFFRRTLMKYLEKQQLKMCDYYYSVSKYCSKLEVLQRFQKKDVGIVYNLPPRLEKDLPSCNSVRQELGLKPNDIVVVSTGRITAEKGFDVLTEVILLSSRNIKFLIVGDGDYLMNMKRATKQLDNVIFVGFVPDVTKYLLASDIFIICSKHETLCNSIIEAGHFGLAALASNVGGIPEIIDDGVSGYLFDYNNPKSIALRLDTLVNNKSERNHFGEALKTKIEDTFSEKNNMQRLKDIYSVAIGS